MSKARLVITALFVDNSPRPRSLPGTGSHRAWVYKLKARYEAEGEAALEPRSRRPKTIRVRHRRRRSSWSSDCASSWTKPAWMPVPTPSAGT